MTASPNSLPRLRDGFGGLPVRLAEGDGAKAGAVVPVDVVVVGAGQAGLSAGYHLRRRGFVPAFGGGEEMTSRGEDDVSREGGAGTYVILDGEDGPGGAWRHRWRSRGASSL